MKNTLLSIWKSPKVLRVLSFGALCVVGSFVLGIETAGEVQPFEASRASSIEEGLPAEAHGSFAGDIDGDGEITVLDVIDILEILQGYQELNPRQLKADPNGDSRLTVEDALRLLRTLAIR